MSGCASVYARQSLEGPGLLDERAPLRCFDGTLNTLAKSDYVV